MGFRVFVPTEETGSPLEVIEQFQPGSDQRFELEIEESHDRLRQTLALHTFMIVFEVWIVRCDRDHNVGSAAWPQPDRPSDPPGFAPGLSAIVLKRPSARRKRFADLH